MDSNVKKDVKLTQSVEYGGCSAKLDPKKLETLLRGMPGFSHPDLLTGFETHDDAGAYRIRDDLALIFTTDFFTPIVDDPYEFGQIAAANALSDVYAMGGEALMALNLVMFSVTKLPEWVLAEILRGGEDKVREAGALVVGGHTIDDHPPKYGLAVLGTVHPDRLWTNDGARPGQVLLLTKPLGGAVMKAGKEVGMISEEAYVPVKETMKQLNRFAVAPMQEAGVGGVTDVTGFGLLGHAMRLAQGSKVTLRIDSRQVPVFEQVPDLIRQGCVPGAVIRNLRFTEDTVRDLPSLDPNLKMMMADPQTSGGLLMSVDADKADALKKELVRVGYPHVAQIGEVTPLGEKHLLLA